MAIARSREGWLPGIAALASQIHPVFMLPPVAVSLIGAILAGSPSPTVAALHALAIFSAVYVAHVKDGYVDFYYREEDDDHPLTIRGCRLGLIVGTAGFGLAIVGLVLLSNWLAVALTLPTWAVGYLHAPTLDTNPVTATLDYPFGIALALLGGYAAHTGTLGAEPVAFAAVLFVLLAGIKIIDDAQDLTWDRDYGKETVAVRLGPTRARWLSYGLMAAAAVAVVAFAAADVLPDGTFLGVLVFGAVAAIAADADTERATMLLVRGAYLFLAFFVVAVWYRPFQGSPTLGTELFGPYIYLAMEAGFGAIAMVLLYLTSSFRSAAKTIALLYPLAYVWDWYSLEVGVFDIVRRTGIEVVGIPLEEHIFIVVVAAFVVGVHEARTSLAASDGD